MKTQTTKTTTRNAAQQLKGAAKMNTNGHSNRNGNGNGNGKKAEKQPPKYLAQQANRKRFSIGEVWTRNVLAGKVKDKDKLVAHGELLGLGTQRELSHMKLEELIEVVQAGIKAEQKRSK